MRITQIVRRQTLVISFAALLLSGCSMNVYNRTVPKSPDFVEKRLYIVENEAKKVCNEEESERLCSLYFMEMGLIYEKIKKLDQDAIHYYRRAVEVYPDNCNARQLLASVLSRKKRSLDSVEEARQVLSDMGNCPEGTYSVYMKAMMDITSKNAGKWLSARENLEGLSTLNVGDSGITQDDIHNLILFSYLHEGNFETAVERMAESPDVNLIPKLEALMLIGTLKKDDLKKFQSNPEVVNFLIKGDESDYFPTTKMEQLIMAGNGKPTTTIPEIVDDGNITSIERKVQLINLREDKRLMDFQLQKREDTIAEIKNRLSILKNSKASLLKAELRYHLEGYAKPKDVYQNYIQASQDLRSYGLKLSEIDNNILAAGNPEKLLDNPEVIIQDAAFLQRFTEKYQDLSEDTIIRELFTSFASKKASSIQFSDFFRPFTLRLDDLSPSSREVKEMVKRLMALSTEKSSELARGDE